MNQREVIRQLLATLPLPQQKRIERAGMKYRTARPLDMQDLWAKVYREWFEDLPNRPAREKKRLELLAELNVKADKA